MTRFEDRLQADLTADDQAFLKSLNDEPGLFEQMGATFTGSLKLWTVFAFLLSFALFALSVWAAWQAWTASQLQHSILWIGLALWASIAVGMIKIWFWLRMNHIVTLREIKRLELQIATLKEM